ncbi:MAG: cupin domain-containing protein [Bryobacteraceae bacterium]|nr:cupin domain-containing protein [Bryobacteraceae bacterium]
MRLEPEERKGENMPTRKTSILIGLAAIVLGVSASLVAQNQKKEQKIFEGSLPNAPGQTLTAEVVDFPPGYKSEVHHHAGSVFAYVLRGKIRSQNSATGPARIYSQGETFFEPPGSDHLVTENPSSTEPASLLAIHIAAHGATLTRTGRAK